MGRRRKDAIPCLSDDDSEDKTLLAQRNANANARERDRMRVLSKGFSKLKTTLPWVPPDTKLSKLDTLRLATCYIAHLRQILSDDNDCVVGKKLNIMDTSSTKENHVHSAMETDSCGVNAMTSQRESRPVSTLSARGDKTKDSGYVHPLNLTWPFSFNGRYTVNVPSDANANRLPTPQSAASRNDVTQLISHTSPILQHDITTS